MKKAFMSLKFHEGNFDKEKIDSITNSLNDAGISNVVIARDIEKYGEASLPDGYNLMRDYAFPLMKECDMLIIEFSEKGVGLGVGAGYAYSNDIPIYIIAKIGSDISSTIKDIAKDIILYNDPKELTNIFKNILERDFGEEVNKR